MTYIVLLMIRGCRGLSRFNHMVNYQTMTISVNVCDKKGGCDFHVDM